MDQALFASRTWTRQFSEVYPDSKWVSCDRWHSKDYLLYFHEDNGGQFGLMRRNVPDWAEQRIASPAPWGSEHGHHQLDDRVIHIYKLSTDIVKRVCCPIPNRQSDISLRWVSFVPGFNLGHYAPGTKHRLSVSIDGSVSLPVLLAKGRSPGKTLVVTSNIHGDEYEGVRAIFELFECLDPKQMDGSFIAVPIANPPAFWTSTRTSPIDGLNLARIFPGDPSGTISEKIAHFLAFSLIVLADFYVDFHSGGIAYLMPSMVGYALIDPRSYEGAVAFGAHVIWGHDTIPPGRSVSFAHSSGIPWIYTEARGGGRIHPEDLEMMKNGIRNLLLHLSILQGDVETSTIRWRLAGDGDIDAGIIASQAGFLHVTVTILENVKKGELLGTLVSPLGEVLESYRAHRDGVVGMVRQLPVVFPGDPLFLIAMHQCTST